MTFLGFTGLANFVTCLLLGTFTFLKNPANPQNRSFFYVNCSVALYSVGYFFWQLSNTPAVALLWFKLLVVGIIFINVTYLHFVFAFVGVLVKKRKELFIYYAINIAFVFLGVFSFLFAGVEPRYGLGLWPIPTALFNIYLLFWFWQCAYGFACLLKGLKTTTGNTHEQIKYIIIAAVVGFCGGATNWPMWYGIRFPPYLNILVSLYIAIVAYAIIRYRLLDIRVALTGAGIFSAVYFLVLGLPFWLGHETKSWVWTGLSMLALASAGPYIFDYLRRRAEARLLADQLRMQEALRGFARNLTHIRDTKQLIKELVETDYAITQPEFLALYSYFPALDGYIPKHTVPNLHYPLGKLVKKDSPLLTPFFTASDTDKYKPVPVELFEADAPHDTFAFPLWNLKSGGLYGFLALGPKCNKIMYAGTDLEIFEIIAAQAAVVLETCLFWEDEKTRLAREEQIRRFKAMDHFSSGMAHEINNPITGVLGRAQGARKTLARIKAAAPDICGQDVAELDKEIAVIFEEVDRVANLIQNVKELSAQNQGEFSVIALDDVMSMFLKIFTPQIKIDDIGIGFSTKLEPGIKLEGNKISLVEVLMNIGINAIYAVKYGEALDLHDDEDEYNRHMAKPKTIEVKTYRTDPGHCRIELRDNGSGIVKDMLEDIFLDFVTTKPSTIGTGMGLAISRKIIESHHGKIWAESEGQYQGAAFIIELPTTDKPLPPPKDNRRYF